MPIQKEICGPNRTARAIVTRALLPAATLLLAGLPAPAQQIQAMNAPPAMSAPGSMGEAAQMQGPPPGSRDPNRDPGQGPMMPHRPPLEQAFHMGPPGRWWDEPQMAKKVGLSAEQQKKMDDIFLQSRLKLIDQHAMVEKDEAVLDPLLSAAQPDETKILAQIDKIAQSRAELEKANARMLLGLRRVLTPAQWQTLQSFDRPNHGDGPPPREPDGEAMQ